jgi:hypothetical protein
MDPSVPGQVTLLAVVLTAIALIAAGSVATAKNGRDFAANYEIQKVNDLGATVEVTLGASLMLRLWAQPRLPRRAELLRALQR